MAWRKRVEGLSRGAEGVEEGGQNSEAARRGARAHSSRAPPMTRSAPPAFRHSTIPVVPGRTARTASSRSCAHRRVHAAFTASPSSTYNCPPAPRKARTTCRRPRRQAPRPQARTPTPATPSSPPGGLRSSSPSSRLAFSLAVCSSCSRCGDTCGRTGGVSAFHKARSIHGTGRASPLLGLLSWPSACKSRPAGRTLGRSRSYGISGSRKLRAMSGRI